MNRLNNQSAQPLDQDLPFFGPRITWQVFQLFCRDYFGSRPDVSSATIFGDQGEEQGGIDVLVVFKTGETCGVQCKRERVINESAARRAISEATFAADKYIIMVAGQVRAPAKAHCRSLGNWEVWDAGDISARVRTLSKSNGRQLVSAYFGPPFVESFLGIRGPVVLQTPAEFFKRWAGEHKYFHHDWPIIGREETLKSVIASSLSPDIRVTILPGIGGSGKTRILKAASQQLQEREAPPEVLFISDGLPFELPYAATYLPDDQTVVFVDDAHRYAWLETVATIAAQGTGHLKLVLATRKHATAQIEAMLCRVGFDLKEIEVLSTVGPLDKSEVQRLAELALGPDFAHLAPQLSQVSRDSVVVTVVGGKLIAEKSVHPRVLERVDQFRPIVLDRFSEEMTGKVCSSELQALCGGLLKLIAILSPMRTDDGELIESIALFLNSTPVNIRNGLGEMESAGLLLRAGRTVRIVPDILSDHIVYRACVNNAGDPNGFAVTVYSAFEAKSKAEMLRNLSELDWRMRSETGSPPDILGEVWATECETFRLAPNSQRREILQHMGRVAFLQPERAWELVRIAIESPSTTPEDRLIAAFVPTGDEHVIQAIPPLLGQIAQYPDHFTKCADLLWKLGKDDNRALNSNYNHSIRVLQELGGYDLNKSGIYSRLLVDSVERWLQVPNAHTHLHSPLDVLDCVLAKEGHSDEYDGSSIHMTPFLVNPTSTAAVRTRALETAGELACSAVLRVAVRAIQTLEHGLAEPHGLMGAVVSREKLEEWEPEQLLAIGLLEKASESATDPVIQARIQKTLHWTSVHAYCQTVREQAAGVRESIQPSFELRLTRALIGFRGDDWVPPRKDMPGVYERALKNHERAVVVRLKQLANEFVVRYPTAESAEYAISERIETLIDAGVEVQGQQFIDLLARNHAKYGRNLLEFIIDHPESLLVQYVPQFLFNVRVRNVAHGRRLAQRLESTGNLRLVLALAGTCQCHDWVADANEEDLSLLRRLLTHEDQGVVHGALWAAYWLSVKNRVRARELALVANIGENADLADLMNSCFIDHGTPVQVGRNQAEALCAKLVPVTSIDDHHTVKVLECLAKEHPDLLVGLFLRRLDRSVAEGNSYDPIPAPGFAHDLSLGSIPQERRKKLLSSILVRTQSRSWRIRMWAPKGFWTVGRADMPTCVEILMERIGRGKSASLRQVACVVSEAPSSFLFEYAELVIGLLEATKRCGEETFQHISGDLHRCAIHGMRGGAPGEPFPEDVELKERAASQRDNLVPGSIGYEFYNSVVAWAESQIRDQIVRGEESRCRM